MFAFRDQHPVGRRKSWNMLVPGMNVSLGLGHQHKYHVYRDLWYQGRTVLGDDVGGGGAQKLLGM